MISDQMENKNILIIFALVVSLILGIYLMIETSPWANPEGENTPDSHKLVVRDTEFVFSAPLEEIVDVPIHPDVKTVVNASLDSPDFVTIGIPKNCDVENQECGALSTAAFDVAFRTSKVYQWLGYDNTYRRNLENGVVTYLNGEPDNYENLTGIRILVRFSPNNRTRVAMVDNVIFIDGNNQTSVRKAADVYTLALLQNYEKYALRKII